jgi:hypothetical protein
VDDACVAQVESVQPQRLEQQLPDRCCDPGAVRLGVPSRRSTCVRDEAGQGVRQLFARKQHTEDLLHLGEQVTEPSMDG